MTLKHVVIGGGTGYIGSAIATALSHSNIRTTAISRMPGPNRISWQEVECNGLPQDTSAVINVAGLNILDFKQRWTPGFKQSVWNSRVKTNEQIAKAVQSSQVKTFIAVSGVAYYPPDGKTYSEDDVCSPYDYLSELCHAWEAAANVPDDSSVRQVIIRSGVVLGRTGGMIQQTFIPFFMGVGGPLGDGKQPMPWIHIKDLVNLFIFALNDTKVSGVLNGVAPQIVTNGEFTKEFASALNRPAIIPVPSFVLKKLLNEERAKIMLEGQKVEPKRVQELGFEYEYPCIREACKQFAVFNYKLPY